jgi:predicted lipoprotein with Yx(FWY)xxD motif
MTVVVTDEGTCTMHQTDRHREATRRRSAGRLALAAVAVAVGALTMAPGVAGAATATTIATAKDSKLGTILVADDAPVYTLKGKACTAACLTTRPAVVLAAGATAATAGSGVESSKLGTVTAADGSLQVTYGGKPLYWSAKDTGSGHPRGAGADKFGKWSVVVTKASPSTGDTNPGTGGSSF